MLNSTCLLFVIPATLGWLHNHYWTYVGCGILTITSSIYYHTGHVIPQRVDTIYAMTYTLTSTILGIIGALRGCLFMTIGVLFSLATTVVYFCKSKRGDADPKDPWHALVHLFGAIGLSSMALSPLNLSTYI